MNILTTPDGTWLCWQDAWRDMGRTEEQIAEELSFREERARSRERGWQSRNGEAGTKLRRRFRTWGKCDENTIKMKARLAPLAGYFLRALKNEVARPSWAIGGRDEMSLNRLYKFATQGGRFGSPDKSVRSRDFGRVVEWCLNTLKSAAAWGFSKSEAAIVRLWLENPDRDAPMVFPAGTWQRMVIDYGLKIKESGAQEGYSQSGRNGCTDASARESFYESKKLLNDTTPAEAGFSPFAHKPASGLTPLVGACAVSQGDTITNGESQIANLKSALKGLENFCSKGDAGNGNGAGRSAEPAADAGGREVRIERFTGKLPRRLWWLVWKWLPAFGRLHRGKNVAWSEAHFVSWFKSCLVAGKRCVDLFDLYDDKLTKWHGLASDWRVPGDRELHPRGLFSELYKSAGALPAFKD